MISANRHARAERTERILEDDLQILAQRPHGAPRELLDVAPEIDDATFRADEAEQGAPERGLARSAFADHPEGLATPDRDIDVVHRLDVADGAAEEPALDREPDAEFFGGDDRFGTRAGGRVAFGLGGEDLPGIGVLRVGEHRFRSGRISTILPSVITWVISAMRRTMCRSCVMNRIAMPRFFCSDISSSRICAWMVTSSAVVGSSAISSCGSLASAMAIITRCRCPPES